MMLSGFARRSLSQSMRVACTSIGIQSKMRVKTTTCTCILGPSSQLYASYSSSSKKRTVDTGNESSGISAAGSSNSDGGHVNDDIIGSGRTKISQKRKNKLRMDEDVGFKYTLPVDHVHKTSHILPNFQLTFLGTGGSTPSRYKGASSSYLNLGTEKILFDAGEGTLRQSIRSGISLPACDHIFITHMHGDHILGLPSVVLQHAHSNGNPNNVLGSRAITLAAVAASAGTKTNPNTGVEAGERTLNIYGPPGLHHYLNTTLQMIQTQASRNTRIIVHELQITQKEFQCLRVSCGPLPRNISNYRKAQAWPWKGPLEQFLPPEVSSWGVSSAVDTDTEGSHDSNGDGDNDDDDDDDDYEAYSYGSKAGDIQLEKREVYPDDSGTWHIIDNPAYTIKSRLIAHKIPCFGYVLQECDVVGKLLMDKIQEHEIPFSRDGYKLIKLGHDVIFPDGKVVKSSQLLGPSQPGRKMTILGDTQNSNNIADLAMNSDVLIHEATFDVTLYRKAIKSGHSTSEMAAKFALKINAKRVVLNHIGAQYVQNQREHDVYLNNLEPSFRVDTIIQDDARHFMKRPNHLVLARDFLSVAIPPGGYDMQDNQFHLSFMNADQSNQDLGSAVNIKDSFAMSELANSGEYYRSNDLQQVASLFSRVSVINTGGFGGGSGRAGGGGRTQLQQQQWSQQRGRDTARGLKIARRRDYSNIHSNSHSDNHSQSHGNINSHSNIYRNNAMQRKQHSANDSAYGSTTHSHMESKEGVEREGEGGGGGDFNFNRELDSSIKNEESSALRAALKNTVGDKIPERFYKLYPQKEHTRGNYKSK